MSETTIRISEKVVGRYTYWRARWMGPDGREKEKTIGRKDGLKKISARQARLKAQRLAGEMESLPGLASSPRAVTLGAWLERYLGLRAAKLKADTIKRVRMTGRYLVAYFGGRRRLDSFTPLEVDEFRGALAGGKLLGIQRRHARKIKALSENTVRTHLRQAKALFRFAVEKGVIVSSPFTVIKDLQPTPADWRYVGRHVVASLCEVAPPSWRLTLMLCRYAALRVEEALHLRWGDVDLDRGRLRVRAHADSTGQRWEPKGKQNREIPMVPELASALAEAFDTFAGAGEVYVVPLHLQGELDHATERFRRLCRDAESDAVPEAVSLTPQESGHRLGRGRRYGRRPGGPHVRAHAMDGPQHYRCDGGVLHGRGRLLL